MTTPETPFEQLSYELNKFRERRMAERRAVPRDTLDRRVNGNGNGGTHENDNTDSVDSVSMFPSDRPRE